MPRHLVLHTPHPTATWPSHLDSTSPLYRSLAQRWAKHPQLSKLGFAVSDAGKGPVAQPWDPKRAKFDEPPPQEGALEESVGSLARTRSHVDACRRRAHMAQLDQVTD